MNTTKEKTAKEIKAFKNTDFSGNPELPAFFAVPGAEFV
jgi:hypothetical protein